MTAVGSTVPRSGVLWTSIPQNATPPGRACWLSLTCRTLSLSNSGMRGLAVPWELQMHRLRWGWKTTAMHLPAQLPRGWYTMWTWVIFMPTEFFVYNVIGIIIQILSALLNHIAPSNCSWVHITKQSYVYRLDSFRMKLNPKMCFRSTWFQLLTSFSPCNQTKASKPPWNT